jgi:hypothetical protein
LLLASERLSAFNLFHDGSDVTKKDQNLHRASLLLIWPFRPFQPFSLLLLCLVDATQHLKHETQRVSPSNTPATAPNTYSALPTKLGSMPMALPGSVPATTPTPHNNWQHKPSPSTFQCI